MTELRHCTVTVDGVRSPVCQTGARDEPEAVVFVHGNPGSRRDWRRLQEAVGGFARTIALDMPGFGRADKPIEFDFRPEGYARHLQGVLERLGVERAHLVLHDFGGPWGLQWAAEHPEHHASTTLINTGVFIRYRWHALARIWRTPVAGELFTKTTTRPGFKLLLKRGNSPRFPEAFADEMYEHLDKGTRRTILRIYRATHPDEYGPRQAAALREHPRPAHVVWGAKDPYIGVEVAHRQREVWPEAEVIELPGSGHWPFADDPEGVERAVLPFLRRVVGTPVEAGAA